MPVLESSHLCGRRRVMLSWLACLLVIGAEIEVVVGGVMACGVHELGILLEAHPGVGQRSPWAGAPCR